MDPQLGRMGFRIATFITLMAGALLLVVPHGTAEFYIAAVSFGIGLLFAATVAFLVRLLSR